MAGNLNISRSGFNLVVGRQVILRIMDEFQGIRGRQRGEEHILRGDQDTRSRRSLERGPGTELRQDVATEIRRRGAVVFLDPIRRQRVGHSKIRATEGIVGYVPVFWNGSYRIACARPSPFD